MGMPRPYEDGTSRLVRHWGDLLEEMLEGELVQNMIHQIACSAIRRERTIWQERTRVATTQIQEMRDVAVQTEEPVWPRSESIMEII